jgi:hypothetical protein
MFLVRLFKILRWCIEECIFYEFILQAYVKFFSLPGSQTPMHSWVNRLRRGPFLADRSDSPAALHGRRPVQAAAGENAEQISGGCRNFENMWKLFLKKTGENFKISRAHSKHLPEKLEEEPLNKVFWMNKYEMHLKPKPKKLREKIARD